MTPGDDLGCFGYLELCNIHVVLAVGLELNFRKSPYHPLHRACAQPQVREAARGSIATFDHGMRSPITIYGFIVQI